MSANTKVTIHAEDHENMMKLIGALVVPIANSKSLRRYQYVQADRFKEDIYNMSAKSDDTMEFTGEYCTAREIFDIFRFDIPYFRENIKCITNAVSANISTEDDNEFSYVDISIRGKLFIYKAKWCPYNSRNADKEHDEGGIELNLEFEV